MRRRSPLLFPALLVFTLVLGLEACGSGGGSSQGGGGGGTGSLSLAVSPTSPTMLPNSALTFSLTANESNDTATPTITSAQLPTGFTTPTTFPLAIPSGGASLTIQTSSKISAGNYNIVLSGQAGSATATLSIPIVIETGPAQAFYFASPIWNEVALPVGGSGQTQVITGINGAADYNVVLSASGLPPGTTATFSPSVVIPGNEVTITINANSNAPLSQNVQVTLTGTPQAPIAPASTNFLASVTPPQNALMNNRTDFVSTDGSPTAAVYDSVHGQIFASNTSWSRVDIISNASHAIVGSVSIPDPLGIDISQDCSTVWVATGSQQVFAINTTTFSATRYQLPGLGPSRPNGAQTWQGNFIYALSDGTLMIYSGSINTNTDTYFSIWDPSSNSLTPIKSPANAIPGIVQRSGDGMKVFSTAGDSSGNSFHYDVALKQFSDIVQLGGYALSAAVNYDGSRVAVQDASGLNMYDGNLNLLGPLPGGGIDGGLPFTGGMVFSPTTGDLYETAIPTDLPFLITIDPTTLQPLTIAPAMGIPGGDNTPDAFIPSPFAVDITGMVLGIQPYGISFDDSTFAQNYSSQQPGFPSFLNHMSPYVGPLSGGTTSGGFGNAFNITPGVWYGQNQGISNNANNDLSITSPLSSVPGPVNLKFLFPDGTEVFDPLFFSYGPLLQHAVLSGSSPDGGAPGEVSGFGIPSQSGGGTLTVGGAIAAIINPPSAYAPNTDAPFPTDTILSFTFPPGTPGYADVGLTTPDGQSTLPKSMFYAQSVKDYSSSGTFNAIVYDANRQQLYLSTGNQIAVFSLSSNEFVSPFTPPALGSSKNFAGLALTPDGSLLLATDLTDGSLAVIDPDNPTASFVIAVTPAVNNDGCVIGPVYVQAASDSLAFVLPGGMPGPGCGPGGSLFQVNLTARSSQVANTGAACSGGGSSLGSSADGSVIAFGGSGFCIYKTSTQSFSGNMNVSQGSLSGAAVSGDGNVAAALWSFLDTTPNLVGSVGRPDLYYSSYISGETGYSFLFQPVLNASGSLYFMPSQDFFDIVDVQHGLLRIRFSLTEQISNVVAPIAIDSGGRHIYLVTNMGLTIVDLGSAPLSIGHLSPSTALSGTQIEVRGSGFSSSTTATIGGLTASISFTDENTITLTVPSVPPGPANIVLTNSDGTTYTLQNAITIN